MTATTEKRIKAFVDGFIRSQAVESLTDERDSDFWNEPERASRCFDAAESGSDGKTHAEVIGDWRDAFSNMLADRRGKEYPERFASAVNSYFDSVEQWHKVNGSLFREIG